MTPIKPHSIFMVVVLMLCAQRLKAQRDTTTREKNFSNISIQIQGGIQQVIMPNNTMSAISFSNFQARTSTSIAGIPFSVTGNLNYLNGVLLQNCSGIGIALDKRKLNDIKSKSEKAKKIANDIAKSKASFENLPIEEATDLFEDLPDLPLDSLIKSTNLIPDSLLPKINMERVKFIRDSLVAKGVKFKAADVFKLTNPELVKKGLEQKAEAKKKSLFSRIFRMPDKKKIESLPLAQFEKGRHFFDRIEDFRIGLSNLAISELVCKSMPYQGISLTWASSDQNSYSVFAGVTSKFPSPAELISPSLLLNSLNPQKSAISTNPADYNLQAQLLVYNRDVWNINSQRFFSGVAYGRNLTQNTDLKISHVYTYSLSSDDKYVPGHFQLTSATISRITEFYMFEVELANSGISTSYPALPPSGDSTYNNFHLRSAPLSLAMNMRSNVKISKNFFLTISYRDLARNFYSPLQLINNNLMNQTTIGSEIRFLNKRILYNPSISKGIMLTGLMSGGTRMTNHHINISVNEWLQCFATYSNSIIFQSHTESSNYIFSGGMNLVVPKIKTLTIQSLYQQYRFNNSDTPTNNLQSAFKKASLNMNYRLKTGMLFLTVDYSKAHYTDFSNARAGYSRKLSKKFILGVGSTITILNQSKWINLFVTCSIVETERIQGQILVDQTVAGNSRPISNGRIQMAYKF